MRTKVAKYKKFGLWSSGFTLCGYQHFAETYCMHLQGTDVTNRLLQNTSPPDQQTTI